ncbi:MAG: Na/Pi cotransporter family protein [Pseudomonas sp.]
MSSLQSVFAAVSAIVLFIYGLQGFSRELRAIGGDALQSWLGRVTESRWLGFSIGVLATAIMQSSSAITSLTTALVDASAISFRASLGVLLGANVGTTATAWLVSLKLTSIGPIFIVLGAFLSMLPRHLRVAGKSVFYFGLIFFALELISVELKPLHQHPVFAQWLALAQVPWLGVLMGVVFTAVVQSSSVTSGIAILLAQQGVLPAEAAIPIVIGANVGSTSTALLASIGMNPAARATAMANCLFNTVGAIIYFPFLQPFAQAMVGFAGDPGMAVAWAHLIFNLTTALAFLLSLDWIEPRICRLLLRDQAGLAGEPTAHPRSKGAP